MNLFIAQLIGEFCVTLEDGQIVFDKISAAINTSTDVELDFEGVRVVVSPFLNAAIGQLLRDFTPNQLNQYLHIINLPLGVEAILARVIENAKTYYSDPIYRNAVDSTMMEEEVEELEHGV